MKPAVLLAAVAASTGVFAAECSYSQGETDIARRYFLGAGLGANPDIAGRCAGLWANLKRFGDCVGVSNPWCGHGGNTPDHLEWHFTVPTTCNTGMVESTWWEATRNEFGAVSCYQRTS